MSVCKNCKYYNACGEPTREMVCNGYEVEKEHRQITREEREQSLLEEFKAAHNNIMTVMENHIMSMVGCDRKTANLVANEVLELDREIESIL